MQSKEIENRLNYSFENKDLLILAFSHRSYANEVPSAKGKHNERLEFLGDSILGLIVSEFLYKYLPDQPEGELSHLRSFLVGASFCAKNIEKLGVESFLLLGKGEEQNQGRGRESILADLFEAIIGAIYLDGGMEAASKFYLSHFKQAMLEAIQSPARNYKAELQDYSQKKTHKAPEYRVAAESGPDHNKLFTVEVLIDNEVVGIGEGSSKKVAEQNAAQDAMEKISGED